VGQVPGGDAGVDEDVAVPDDARQAADEVVDGDAHDSGSAKTGGRLSKNAFTASTWLGEPISDLMARSSALKPSASDTEPARFSSSLAPRTAWGFLAAI